MTEYQVFAVETRSGWLRAFVAEKTELVAKARLLRDDPVWKRGIHCGSYRFDDEHYHCRPRTKPFICILDKPA